MNKNDSDYRTYFVKNDVAASRGTTGLFPRNYAAVKYAWTRRGSELVWRHAEVDLFRADGSRVGRAVPDARGGLRFELAKPGLYWARIKTDGGRFQQFISAIP